MAHVIGFIYLTRSRLISFSRTELVFAAAALALFKDLIRHCFYPSANMSAKSCKI